MASRLEACIISGVRPSMTFRVAVGHSTVHGKLSSHNAGAFLAGKLLEESKLIAQFD